MLLYISSALLENISTSDLYSEDILRLYILSDLFMLIRVDEAWAVCLYLTENSAPEEAIFMLFNALLS